MWCHLNHHLHLFQRVFPKDYELHAWENQVPRTGSRKCIHWETPNPLTERAGMITEQKKWNLILMSKLQMSLLKCQVWLIPLFMSSSPESTPYKIWLLLVLLMIIITTTKIRRKKWNLSSNIYVYAYHIYMRMISAVFTEIKLRNGIYFCSGMTKLLIAD